MRPYAWAALAIAALALLLLFANFYGATYVSVLASDTKCLWLENPTAADDLQSIWHPGNPATLTSIWGESNQTATFMLRVDDGTPEDVDTVDLVVVAGTAVDSDLNGDTTMAAGDRLDLDLVSVANGPTWLSICWTVNWV